MIKPSDVVISGMACLFGYWIGTLILGTGLEGWYIVGIFVCVTAILISHYGLLAISRGRK